MFSFRSWAFISILLPFASLITAVSIGGAAAVLVTSAVAAVYIPSAVSTVLKFRSGVLGSLRDKKFQLYRVARTYRFATGAIERGASILQPSVLCFCALRLRPLHLFSQSGLTTFLSPFFLCLVADLTTILFGSAFWGIIYTAGVLFAIVAGVSFFVLWPVSRFPISCCVTI